MKGKIYISAENTNALKGIMAIMVMVSHIYTSGNFRFSNPALAFVFGSALGYIPVSVFFFLSGFGLMSSYQKKGRNYIRTFPRNRVLPIYIVSLVMIAIYSIVSLLVGQKFSVSLFLRSLTFGGTVIKYGWYLQTIIVLYFVFWLSFSFKINDNYKVYVFCTWIILMYVSLLLLDVEPTWYATSPCMALGVLWARFYNRIEEATNTNFKLWLHVVILIALGGFAKIIASFLPTVKNISYLFQVTTTAAFSVSAIILLLKKVSLCGLITNKLGLISLEIYTTQGLAIILIENLGLDKLNVIIYGVLVITITIILAISIHPVFKKINEAVRTRC